MLRITDVRETLADGTALWTLRLDGDVQGDWIKQCRRAWQAVRLAAAGASIRVLLGDVEVVDVAGEALLVEMASDGVDVVASDGCSADVRERIRSHRLC